MSKDNLPDMLRFLTGFLLALQLLLHSFGINFLKNNQIEAIVNIISFLYILYFGAKHNYLGKKGQAQKAVLQKAGLEKRKEKPADKNNM